MVLELRKAQLHDFPALQQMLELYQYELSDIWPQDTDPEAKYGYNLERHKQGERFHAHVAIEGSQYVGFALVAPAVVTRTEGHWMEQFFIFKRFRRSGAGYALAKHVLRDHPGAWEVGQMPANLAAQAFWRRVIEKVTSGSCVEVQVTEGWWQGVVQQFHVPAAVSDSLQASQPMPPARFTMEERRVAHAAELFEALRDPRLYEFLDETPPSSVQELAEKLARSELRRSPDGKEHWLNWVVRAESGAVAGYVQATVEESKVTNVAYVFSAEFQGQGIASAAVQQMLDIVVAEYQATLLLVVADAANLRSIRLAERLGFTVAPAEIAAERQAGPNDIVLCLRRSSNDA